MLVIEKLYIYLFFSGDDTTLFYNLNVMWWIEDFHKVCFSMLKNMFCLSGLCLPRGRSSAFLPP